MCDKHNKECSYLRPTKRRGPQKGYRTALNTYKESAAAWGAVLGAIPGLDALIEGHLRSENGRALLKTIKDTSQQDTLINRWQQSTVFKTFFPNGGDAAGSTVAGSVVGGEDDDDAQMDGFSNSGGASRKHASEQLIQQQIQQQLQLQQQIQMSPPQPFNFSDPSHKQGHMTSPNQHHQIHQSHVQREVTSLSDIVAKDAARSYVLH